MCVISVCVCSLFAGVFAIKRSGSTVSTGNNYFQLQRAAVLRSKMPQRCGVRNKVRFVMDSKDVLRDRKVANAMKVSPMSDDQTMPLVPGSTYLVLRLCLCNRSGCLLICFGIIFSFLSLSRFDSIFQNRSSAHHRLHLAC